MSAPSPDLFLDAALGYQKTASIKAAIALDLFTAIAQEEGIRAAAAALSQAGQGREVEYRMAPVLERRGATARPAAPNKPRRQRSSIQSSDFIH